MLSQWLTLERLDFFLLIALWLLAIVLAISFASRIYHKIVESRRNRRRAELAGWLVKRLDTRTKVTKGNFPKKFRSLSLAINVLEYFEENFLDDYWPSLRDQLMEQFFLPYARKYAGSLVQQKRHYACRAFILRALAEDEASILKLLNDRSISVRIEAALSAAQIGSELLVETMMERLSTEPQRVHFAYRDAMKKGSHAIARILIKRLDFQEDVRHRVVYFELLADLLKWRVCDYIEKDIESKDVHMRRQMANILARFPRHAPQGALQTYANDQDPINRAYALEGMSKLERVPNKKIIEALADKEWNVRLKAAHILKEQKKLSGLPDVDAVQYVRAMPEGVKL